MTESSFETMTVKKLDIELPYRFSARMKGQNDVTVTPQVSGQLMKICVTEGQQVKKGQTLFIIDSRNAQLELEAAQANLQAALAQENSAKLEYESNKNLFDKKIVSSYMLNNSENSYKQAQAAVAQARASVNRAKVNLGFCTITATVSGIIGEIPVRVGDQVSPMTSPVTQVAEVAVNRDVRNPADRPFREEAGRESSSVPAAMIPRNIKAMIRLILTDRRNFRGSLRRVNKRMIFLFLIRHIMNSTCKSIHPKPG